MIDKLLWDYMMKKSKNNISHIVKTSGQVIVLTATTTREILIEAGQISTSYDPRESTYPEKGKQDLIHSLTGKSLKRHREGYIYPQSATEYKYPQISLRCTHSIKKMTDTFSWRTNLDPNCGSYARKAKSKDGYVCRFLKEPSFVVRGLCKEAQMDTQYKLEDHRPGEFGWGKDSRGFVGPKGWRIFKNLTDNRWRMSHYYYVDYTLTMMDLDALPVGRHKWMLENNICNEGQTSSMVLQISGCEEGQFTCDDGKCIDIHQRCNNIEVSYLHFYTASPKIVTLDFAISFKVGGISF